MALRELGMSLAEVRTALDDGTELGAVLRAHLAHVDQALARQTALRERLAVLCARAEDGISTDDLLLTIEGMAMHERYFTEPATASRGTMDGEMMTYLRRALETLPRSA